MPERLSVIIPCKNESANMRACLESVVSIADEILVADSGSTDGTLELVRAWDAGVGKCRIVEREYVHSGDFKNWAIPQARHPWVLIVDADERVTPELAAEIRTVLASPRQDGFWIRRRSYFLGHLIRFCGWQNDMCLRLFRRDAGRYVGDTDHAEVAIDTGRVGMLAERLLHFTYRDYDQYFRKFHRYTTHQAQVWHDQGRRVRPWKLALSFPVRFFQLYVLRLGFLDGLAGLQLCLLSAMYSFMKQARLWAHTETRPAWEEFEQWQDSPRAAA